jgi:tripartite-type tricarboxylate transporter receptor subunit TctC
MRRRWLLAACAAMMTMTRLPAAAQTSEETFFKGKVITCYIGYGPGGGYDAFARLISKHMSKHIPGAPTIVPVNMPGASSMTLANFLAKVAPKDGTAFGAVNSALIFDPLFAGSASKAQFTGPDLTMIGNAVSSAAVLVSWRTAQAQSMADLLAGKSLVVGATSRTGDTYLLPLAIKKVLGLSGIKIITGYPGTREAALALEQGEITGRMWDMEGIKAGRPEWLKDGSLKILAQLAPTKMPEVPSGVPLIKEFVSSETDKAALDVIFMSTILARPYIAPPNMPPERVRTLRTAFAKTLKDPAFLEDVQKLQLTIGITEGQEMQEIVNRAYASPPDLIARVRELLSD